MASLAMTTFLDSEFGEITELPRCGSALEHPLVYDSAARELKDLAQQGRLQIIHEHQRQSGDGLHLIDRLAFRRIQ